MLTNLYYYDHYKPFIINKKDSISAPIAKTKNGKKATSYYLNKSLNTNVCLYIENLSTSFNTLKNISNNILEKPKYTLDKNKKNLISSFTLAYNDFIKFLRNNSDNSKDFKNIENIIKDSIIKNKEFLKDININVSDDMLLSFNNEEIACSLTTQNVKSFYKDMYSNLCSFMKEPMSNHMNFKEFSYYFNYSYAQKNASFKMIEQGILIDIAL